MRKLILNSKYTIHQKLVLIVLFLITFLYGFTSNILIISGEYINSKTQLIDYIFPLLLPVSIYIFILIFSKQGIIFDSDKLSYCQFIFGIPIKKEKIYLKDITDVSVLTVNISQKFNFFSAANPDLAERFSLRKIYLLNENHSIKRLIISLKNKELSDKVVTQIQNEFNYNLNNYSPPRSIGRRR